MLINLYGQVKKKNLNLITFNIVIHASQLVDILRHITTT